MPREDPGRDRFDALYAENYARVLAYCRRRGDPDPEGTTADAFLVCWRRLPDVPAPALPWLYRVANLQLRNAVRKRQRHLAALPDVARAVPLSTPGPESAADPDLAAALRSLSARHREVLLLAAWEGLAGADLARALGCSTASARVRLHRARRALTAALGPEDAADRPEEPPRGAVSPPRARIETSKETA